ncbi:hypothetical protein [Roseibacillus persicicus]
MMKQLLEPHSFCEDFAEVPATADLFSLVSFFMRDDYLKDPGVFAREGELLPDEPQSVLELEIQRTEEGYSISANFYYGLGLGRGAQAKFDLSGRMKGRQLIWLR